MRFSSAILAFLAGQTVSAGPIQKRALSANDIAVLQLAHFLENLEYNLYTGGRNNFTAAQYDAAGFPQGFINSVGLIASHENTHRTFLASVLESGGQTPLPECTYSFPYSDPTSFVALANMITSTGIGAYIGGAALVMDNPTILTAAGSILSIEARHDSILRRGIGADPAPNAFDTPVTALWAYSIAHAFIVSCPVNLYPTALPKLTVAAPAPIPNLRPQVPAGTSFTFTWDPATFFVAIPASTPVYIFFVNQATPPVFVPAGTAGAGSATVPLPSGIAGAAFAGLSTFSSGDATFLSQTGTLAGPMIVELS